jgi:hypothetical protein
MGPDPAASYCDLSIAGSRPKTITPLQTFLRAVKAAELVLASLGHAHLRRLKTAFQYHLFPNPAHLGVGYSSRIASLFSRRSTGRNRSPLFWTLSSINRLSAARGLHDWLSRN